METNRPMEQKTERKITINVKITALPRMQNVAVPWDVSCLRPDVI